MADQQAVYEQIAETMRNFGYRDVTAAVVRDIDEASSTEPPEGVIAMFAARQLKDAREDGRLPPVGPSPALERPPAGREQPLERSPGPARPSFGHEQPVAPSPGPPTAGLDRQTLRADVPAPPREFLAEIGPEALDLALWLRGVVLAAQPDLTEHVYSGWQGLGFRHRDAGYVCALYARQSEVRLQFERGTYPDDPRRILEGEGQSRHVTMQAADPSLEEELGRLVQSAVEKRLHRR